MRAKVLKEALSHIDDDTNIELAFIDDYPNQDDDIKCYYLDSIEIVIDKKTILKFRTEIDF